jgi:hypothetical protein
MPKSFLERVSSSIRGRFSEIDDKTVPMLDGSNSDTVTSGNEMDLLTRSGRARTVEASSVSVAFAQTRSQDTEHLRRKENVFYALFRKPQEEIRRVNPRIAEAEWGDLNPHFMSKLLVSSRIQPHFLPLASRRSTPPR